MSREGIAARRNVRCVRACDGDIDGRIACCDEGRASQMGFGAMLATLVRNECGPFVIGGSHDGQEPRRRPDNWGIESVIANISAIGILGVHLAAQGIELRFRMAHHVGVPKACPLGVTHPVGHGCLVLRNHGWRALNALRDADQAWRGRRRRRNLRGVRWHRRGAGSQQR
jgi:hypothetical protein